MSRCCSVVVLISPFHSDSMACVFLCVFGRVGEGERCTNEPKNVKPVDWFLAKQRSSYCRITTSGSAFVSFLQSGPENGMNLNWSRCRSSLGISFRKSRRGLKK